VVDPFGVVEEEPIHETFVEAGKVEEEYVVVVDEVLLDGAVEALDVSIHLRRLGVGVVVGDLELQQSLGEEFLELAPIVGENEGGRIWEHLLPHTKKLFRRLGGVRDRAPGETETRVDVFACDDVPAEAMHEPLHGVECDDVPRVLCSEIVGLPQDFPAFVREYFPLAGCPEWRCAHAALVRDDATDRRRFWTRKTELSAELDEEGVQLLLAEVRVQKTQTSELVHDTPVVSSLTFLLGSAGATVETLEFPSTLSKLPLPQVQRAFLHPVCLFGRGKTVRFPEADNLRPLLRLFADHIREPYRVFLCCPRTFDAPINVGYPHAPSS